MMCIAYKDAVRLLGLIDFDQLAFTQFTFGCTA